jgi:hypothetical protein
MLAVRSLHRVRSQRLDTLHDLGQSFGFRDHKKNSSFTRKSMSKSRELVSFKIPAWLTSIHRAHILGLCW